VASASTQSVHSSPIGLNKNPACSESDIIDA
ncbi:unnamed protein product, partial [Rotaria socialis]